MNLSILTFAYLDPGTGSFVIQMLLAGILGASFTIAFYYKKLKLFVARIFGSKHEPTEQTRQAPTTSNPNADGQADDH